MHMNEQVNAGLRGLRDPLVVATFSGWSDAGNAASAAVEHLAEAYQAELAYELDPDEFYDYQVNRPEVALNPDGEREITWPTTRIKTAQLAGGRDPILVEAYGIGESTYEGPTGIVGVMADLLARSGMPTMSVWAAIPHYVSHPPCPKATLAILSQLERLLDVPLDFGELPELARAWERGVNELAAEDSEVAEYVAQLEEQQDAAELPEASGDAIAAEFERYLKRRGN